MEEQEEFIVTARKFRPLLFSSVVGQEHITRTLQNALLSKRLHHAFLFCGPRGVGKTTTARILGRAVNCLNLTAEGEPCNECENCRGVLKGNSLDVIEIDGASNNGVDTVRQLREDAMYPPGLGNYKVYIIDEVHMLSTTAFNALLKILEEPPKHLIFVLCTTESHKLIATIVSRCQRYDFKRMEIGSIVEQLQFISSKENIKIDEKSLFHIAKKSDGSMRDSQSIFDQVVSFCGKDIKFENLVSALHLIDEEFFFRISDCIVSNNLNEAFLISKEVIDKGYEMQETLSGLLEHFRNLLSVKAMNNASLIQTADSLRDRYIATANKINQTDLLRYIKIIEQTESALRFSTQPNIRFELALAEMAAMENIESIKGLIDEIRNIKETSVVTQRIVEVQQKPIIQEKVKKEEQETPVPFVAPPEEQNNKIHHKGTLPSSNETTIEITETGQDLLDMFDGATLI